MCLLFSYCMFENIYYRLFWGCNGCICLNVVYIVFKFYIWVLYVKFLGENFLVCLV